jgi:hypothetical protein
MLNAETLLQNIATFAEDRPAARQALSRAFGGRIAQDPTGTATGTQAETQVVTMATLLERDESRVETLADAFGEEVPEAIMELAADIQDVGFPGDQGPLSTDGDGEATDAGAFDLGTESDSQYTTIDV